jgi:DnaJ-class molecular chaperone
MIIGKTLLELLVEEVMVKCEACRDYELIRCPACEGSGRLLLWQSAGFMTSKCTQCNESGEIQCPSCTGSITKALEVTGQAANDVFT